MNDIKTILLIGRTGNGKSTLANVVSGTNKFTESEFAVSETKKIAEHIFSYEGKWYRIIDTVGVGDTRLTLDKVLRKLALMGYSVKDGISQILFVTDGRIAEEAKSTYDLLRKVVFDENIAQYTTVVRTKFANFRREDLCEKDRSGMSKNSEGLRELVGECKKIVYVDNPSLVGGNEIEKKINEERRNDSRELLMKHLDYVCKNNAKYRPTNLIVLNSEIGEYVVVKKEIKKEKARKGNSEKTHFSKKEEERFDNKFSKEKSPVVLLSAVTNVGTVIGNTAKGFLITEKGLIDNKFLNKKITEIMLRRIGDIDLGLEENIEKEIKYLESQREKGKEKVARWKFISKKFGAVGGKIGEISSSISELTQRENDGTLKKKILERKATEARGELEKLTSFSPKAGSEEVHKLLLNLYLEDQIKNLEESKRKKMMMEVLKEDFSQEKLDNLLGKKLKIMQIENQLNRHIAFEIVRENVSQWQIKQVVVSRGCVWSNERKDWVRYTDERKEIMLVHQSVVNKIEERYDEWGNLQIDPVMMHYKHEFNNEEWNRIEQQILIIDYHIKLIERKLKGEISLEIWETHEILKRELEIKLNINAWKIILVEINRGNQIDKKLALVRESEALRNDKGKTTYDRDKICLKDEDLTMGSWDRIEEYLKFSEKIRTSAKLFESVLPKDSKIHETVNNGGKIQLSDTMNSTQLAQNSKLINELPAQAKVEKLNNVILNNENNKTESVALKEELEAQIEIPIKQQT